MKTKIKLYLLLMGFALALSYSCSKDGNTTSPIPTGPVPILTTSAVILNKTQTICGGNITSDGGSTVTVRGICWSTGTAPTIADSKTSDGSGAGIFTSIISNFNLSSNTTNTTYYVRAYATNANGTGYGSTMSFTIRFAIGQCFQGGILAYILQSGNPGYDPNVIHGLIVAPDLNPNIAWCNIGVYKATGATATAIGTGNANTNKIIASQGGGQYAAQFCANLTLNGYSDWYLPSKDELGVIYLHKDTIGGFFNVAYWSSTENGLTRAWALNFNDGSLAGGIKDAYYFYMCAVRSF